MHQQPIQEIICGLIEVESLKRSWKIRENYDSLFRETFVTKFDFHKLNQIRDEISLKVFEIKEYLEIPFLEIGQSINFINDEKEESYDLRMDSKRFLQILKRHKLENQNLKTIIDHEIIQNTIEKNALDDFKIRLSTHFNRLKEEFPNEYEQFLENGRNIESREDTQEEISAPTKKLKWNGSGEALIYLINGLYNLGYLEFPKKEGSHDIDLDMIVDQLKGSFDFTQIKPKTIKEYLENKSGRKLEPMQDKVIERLKFFFGDKIAFTPDKLNESKLFFLCPKGKIILE